MKTYKEIKTLLEDGISVAQTNTVGSGNIAGANQDPPGPKLLFKKKKLLTRNPSIKENTSPEESLSYATSLFLMCREISTLTHFYHLSTGSFSVHSALDTFYKDIIDLADKFAETYIGENEKFKEYHEINYFNKDNPLESLEQFKSWVVGNRDKISSESDIQNIIDEIIELTNSTIYKIRELH